MSKTYSTTDHLALHDKAFRVTAHEAGVRPLGGVGEASLSGCLRIARPTPQRGVRGNTRARGRFSAIR